MRTLDKQLLKRTLRQMGQQYPFLKLAYLHGSYTGTGFAPTPLSDVDIALIVDEKYLKQEKWEFEMELETLLGKTLGEFPFDVRIMNESPLDFQGKVITEGERFYAADEIFGADYEEKIRKLYFDFKFFIDNYCRERLHTIHEQGLTHG